MMKISDVVQEILFSSETTLTTLAVGHLNLSAYAKSIRKEVEERTKKAVRPGSIIVALSRLAKTVRTRPSILPEVAFESIAVKSGLVEVAFDKTEDNRKRLKLFYDDPIFVEADFFTITQGVSEISIIAPQKLKNKVIAIFKNQKPKLILENLASLTIKIDGKHIAIPNTFYAVMRYLAVKQINVAEVVSTYTELTFLLHQRDLEEAFLIFNQIFQKKDA